MPAQPVADRDHVTRVNQEYHDAIAEKYDDRFEGREPEVREWIQGIFTREVFPALLSDGVRLCGYVDATYFRDMGTPEDLVRGSADLVRGIAPSPALGGHRGEKLVHDGAAVAPGALLIGGTVVGRGAEIGPGARLDGAVIFDGVRVEAGSVIERSIIGFGARIGPRALIRDGVIGDGADIGARCELLRGARVWPGVTIPDGGIRYSSDV